MAEAQRCISSREFAEWMAYYRIDPFGPVRGDLQAGIVASTLVNLFRKEANSAPSDFKLSFGHRVQRSAQDLFGLVKTAFLLSGAKKK